MTPLEGLRFTDRDLIEKIVENYFIVDYGFITEINPDGTVNVTHAKRGVTIDGKVMPETQTSGVEVLTIACAEFSIKLTPKKGDNVLLLGLRNYLDHAGNIKQATPNDIFLHYQQNTMKAVPLSLFDDNAKVTIKIENGEMIQKAAKSITIDSPNTKLTGGIVEIGGTVAPEGQGALCGVPFCLFTGAPHSGSKSSGT